MAQGIERGLVKGLAALLTADIVETVAIQPTFSNIGIPAMIGVLRTFPGRSVEVELEGQWPWEKPMLKKGSSQQACAPDGSSIILVEEEL